MKDYTRSDFKGCEECKTIYECLDSFSTGWCCARLKRPHRHNGSMNRYRKCMIKGKVIQWWNDYRFDEILHEATLLIEMLEDVALHFPIDGKKKPRELREICHGLI